MFFIYSGRGQCATLRRRPHSWNGDEEALKKCAAIECLLSATDDDQWGPVEKLVDELCARLKLLQLEKQTGEVKQRWTNHGSAPECFDAATTSSSSSSDSDSFTSVSSPEGGDPAEHYRQAFPPLEYLSDSDQVICIFSFFFLQISYKLLLFKQSVQPVTTESIWNVRKIGEKSQSRVRFVRMPGTRLSPNPQQQMQLVGGAGGTPTSSHVQVYGESCASEAYFGDCSRDSSIERAPTPELLPAAPAVTKGRLYERGTETASDLSDVLNNAFKSFCQLHETNKNEVASSANWQEAADWSRPALDPGNIWAPGESDWALMGPEPVTPWSTATLAAPADTAVQLSLALLNHHPERSGFSPVLARSLLQKALPKSSKLLEWLANLSGGETTGQQDLDEKEVEHILKETDRPEEEEEENLLTSPKTHFCPIQQEGADVEVNVSDGATFDVDAQPEEVHFLRSPSGALYLPDCEENGDGWKGWAKYMVYKLPPSPSPLLALPPPPAMALAEEEDEDPVSRSSTPFTLKFRVVQTEKCCQTESRLSTSTDPSSVPSVSSYPFAAALTAGHGLLDAKDVWKFDAEAVTKDLNLIGGNEEEEEEEPKEEEMVDGLLNEVWNVAAALNDDDDDDDGESVADVLVEEEETRLPPDVTVTMVPAAGRNDPVEEFDLDELWNPFMEETGGEQVDVCEWIPQPPPYGMDVGGGGGQQEQWADPDAMVAESWPPPNIPVEYLDDEFFEEIYGSLDSMKTSETAGGGASGGGAGKNSRRRRRRSSQKQQTARRPKRPCSFFVEGECRRPDCKFSHDLGTITCRFWIESSCFKGKLSKFKLNF